MNFTFMRFWFYINGAASVNDKNHTY